jgi:hypothetical protein
MSGATCVAQKRSAPHTLRPAENRSGSPAAFAGSPRSGLGARSTATKETLRAGAACRPRPSRKPDPDDETQGLFIIIELVFSILHRTNLNHVTMTEPTRIPIMT